MRRGGDKSPRAALAEGNWPDGPLRPDAPVAAVYAQALSRRLRDVTEGLSLRAVAERTGVDHTTVRDVLRGDVWPDLATIARLETGLGETLWPAVPKDAGTH